LLSTCDYAQGGSIDTIKWNEFKKPDIPINFIYPNFFTEDFSTDLKLYNGVKFLFVDRSETFIAKDSSVYHFEYSSDFTIILSNRNSSEIADDFGYTIEDEKWYDSYTFESPAPESVEEYNFKNWKGYYNVISASVYFVEGGAFSAGADDDRYVLMRRIDPQNVLYVFANGFCFDYGGEVLKRICDSIIIK
jgi:hypothetical protein